MRTFSYLLYASLAVTLTCTGCKKWLDVQPEDQVSDDKLFENADGFRNALNGVYQQISEPTLYGRQLTWGLVSALGQDYNVDRINSQDGDMAEFLYNSVSLQGDLSRLWASAYTSIANCNKILGEITSKDTMFFPLRSAEKNLIIGEAKAVRALLHFELVRLFAPAPINNRNGKAIPYQTQYPARITPPSTTAAVMDSIIRDLEEAQSLVARNDTIVNRTVMSQKLQSLLSGGNTPNGGLFFNFRLHRLNYVAIQGMLARVYLYNGNRAKAFEKAEYLYKHFGPAGRLKWWAFTPSWYAEGADKFHKLVDDVIFAGYDQLLIQKTLNYKAYYADFALSPETTTWFPDNRDYRKKAITANNISEKWLENMSTQQWRKEQNTIMPILRFSEIYYIYSECLFEKGEVTEALKVLNQIRQARGTTTTFSGTTPTDFYNELFDEYRREFIVEGQTVFNHKRINRPIMLGTRRIEMDDKFVVPIPEGETNF